MQMLMDLGANVYSEDFEQHFLAKAAEFYQVSLCSSLTLLIRCPSMVRNKGRMHRQAHSSACCQHLLCLLYISQKHAMQLPSSLVCNTAECLLFTHLDCPYSPSIEAI